jgi:hypothetical protein
MRKLGTHHFIMTAYGLFFILGGVLYTAGSDAQTNPAPGTQVAFYVGYHSGGHYRGSYEPNRRYINSPRHYYRSSYRTPWTNIGHNCRKSCWIDRWTGRTLRCYRTC